jgi:hypothetical protein
VTCQPADAEPMRLLVECARMRRAYGHDPQFAVSLSGIRTLPHQLEAVYLEMLPQPSIAVLLADIRASATRSWPGLKQLKLRKAVERILVLCPAPLTIQRQDELLRLIWRVRSISYFRPSITSSSRMPGSVRPR